MSNRTLTLGVVVPIYGELEHIKICIGSIDNQSMPWDFKVAVIDAVENDQIRNFIAEQKGWIVINNDFPLGIIESTEIGIGACDSEFVALVDCDDVLHSETVKTVRNVIDEEDASLALISFRYKLSEDVEKIWDEWSKSDVEVIPLDTRREISVLYGSETQLLLDHNMASHLKVFRKDLMDSISPEFHGVQDAVAVHKSSLRGRVIFRPECLYLYRVHAQQTSTIQEVAQIRKINRYRCSYLRRGLAAPDRYEQIRAIMPWLKNNGGQVSEPSFIVLRNNEVEHADFLTFSKWEKVHQKLEAGQVVVFTVQEWFDFGALSGFADDDFPGLLVLNQSTSKLDDVAKWYGGYFDAVLCKTKIETTVLAQFLPLQIFLTCNEED